LQPGTYNIEANVKWAPEDVKDYTISIYASSKVPLKEIDTPDYKPDIIISNSFEEDKIVL
jgi:hypothetical protein